MSEKTESVCYNMCFNFSNLFIFFNLDIVAISTPNFNIFHNVVTVRQLEKCLFWTDARTDGRIDRWR